MPTPTDAQDVTWMAAERWIGDIHHRIVLLTRLVASHPEMMAARAERLHGEAELLRMLAEAAEGTTSDELEATLAAWTGGDE